jgi:hypothetical protein
MFRLTPRFARRILIPVSGVIFVAGLVFSSAIFYSGRPFDAKAAIISDLESPDDNPRGYGASAAGTAAAAILLAPVAAVFYRRLRRVRPVPALIGALMFALGLGAAIAVGILAPFTRGYSPVHIQLAYAAFIGIWGSAFFHFIAAGANRLLIALQGGVLLFLAYSYFVPEFFNNDRLLSGLAFWEWMLCLGCEIGLWILARTVEGLEETTAANPRSA